VFRDYRTGCLLNEGVNKVHWKELRLTREQFDLAVIKVDELWPQFHKASRSFSEATAALVNFISQFGSNLNYFPIFLTTVVFAKHLGVEERKSEFAKIEQSLRHATQEKQTFSDSLSSQEAWYARNEIVRFVKTPRFETNLINFAKAMAGLPDCSWISSYRHCSPILKNRPIPVPTLKYQLLELTRAVVKRVKPVNMTRIEAMLRDKVLKQEIEAPLRQFVSPRWADLKQAFADCKGKGIPRKNLPNEIMAKFLHHLERSKTPAEMALAAREQLI
jgi:hypothetical protein